MIRIFAVLAALLAIASANAQTDTIDLTDDPARHIASLGAGIPRGQELPADDARIKQTREWIKQAAAATGESEEQVAAAAVKLSRYFFDAAGMRVNPMETLEGMARYARPGTPLSDLTNGYFQARQTAPKKTHAEAMATLAAKAAKK